MMGQRRFAAKLYYQLSLDRLVPQDHLLRRIAAAVDFSFVRPLCRRFYSHTGQPSVDPVVLFKMLLVGYLYGITSERRLAREVGLHLAYRWFLGYDLDEPTPDHSVLSKARARLGPEVFEEFFHRSIDLCRQAGLLTEGRCTWTPLSSGRRPRRTPWWKGTRGLRHPYPFTSMCDDCTRTTTRRLKRERVRRCHRYLLSPWDPLAGCHLAYVSRHPMITPVGLTDNW